MSAGERILATFGLGIQAFRHKIGHNEGLNPIQSIFQSFDELSANSKVSTRGPASNPLLHVPFRWFLGPGDWGVLAFDFDSSTARTLRHLPVAFDLTLAASIASLA